MLPSGIILFSIRKLSLIISKYADNVFFDLSKYLLCSSSVLKLTLITLENTKVLSGSTLIKIRGHVSNSP